MFKRHWTPEYVWHRVIQIVYHRSQPDAPWLTEGVVQILDRWLQSNDIGIEWGSGRSTVWLAKRVGHLLALEHDSHWARTVSAKLRTEGLTNVDFRLASGTEYSSPGVEDESADFAIVDGVDRDECAVNATRYVRSGGILLIDDVHRYLPSRSHSPLARTMDAGPLTPQWNNFLHIVRDWRCGWTSSGVSDTAFWIKP